MISNKFQRSGILTWDSFSRRILKVCILGQIEAWFWKPKIVISQSRLDYDSVKGIFRQYERLTRKSGLELNADKTEILSMHTDVPRVYDVQYVCMYVCMYVYVYSLKQKLLWMRKSYKCMDFVQVRVTHLHFTECTMFY